MQSALTRVLEMFTNFAMKRHKPNCNGTKEGHDCPECGKIFSSNNNMRKHYDKVHKKTRNSSNIAKPSPKVSVCKNGISCDWLSNGSCSFFHPNVGVQKPWTSINSGRQETRGTGVEKDFRRPGG